ncbi:uroporphyrinogen-III synthase [Nisaea nitritireducens]|uniref:uroporphyrinogen-III synthase n=1 Tax=Nisaea nitritireducens TaxID=568392 RepID=UPI001867E847|nr:uroporphyrinogen-III synthase [Nisaea nitritireducens]
MAVRVLVTRAIEDGLALQAELLGCDIDAVLAPMLSFEFFNPLAEAEDPVQAYLITSRNGAEALARYTESRTVPVLAVGAATAERLAYLGFESVESADGDAADLAALARSRLDPAAGPLIFLSAEIVAGDIEGALSADGFDLRRIIAYRGVPERILARDVEAQIRAGEIQGVLFFSPRAGRTFISLVEQAGLASFCDEMTAYCLSDAVADAVSTMPWAAVRIAAKPTKGDLLALLAAPCHKDA